MIGRKFADLCGDGHAIYGALCDILYCVLQATQPCDLAMLRHHVATAV